jgi:hypothetical protein
MIGGFEPIPKFRRIFNPSEYQPKWAVFFMCPILLLLYAYFFTRKVLRR